MLCIIVSSAAMVQTSSYMKNNVSLFCKLAVPNPHCELSAASITVVTVCDAALTNYQPGSDYTVKVRLQV